MFAKIKTANGFLIPQFVLVVKKEKQNNNKQTKKNQGKNKK